MACLVAGCPGLAALDVSKCYGISAAGLAAAQRRVPAVRPAAYRGPSAGRGSGPAWAPVR